MPSPRAVVLEFFGQHPVVGKPLGDGVAAHPLHLQVDPGDEIDRSLLVDLEVAAEVAHLNLTGTQDDVDRRGQPRGGMGH